MRPEASAEFRAGAAAIFPAVVAVIPFGLLLGARAAQQGLSTLEVVVMSASVFAGSAQFIVVDLWTEPAPWLLALVATLLVNSRHLLMGASLAPKIDHFGRGRSLAALFLMADETWAMAERRAAERRLSFAYYLGLGLVLWLNWIFWTGLGAAAGTLLEDPAALGFDFAFTAIFLTLLVGLWRGPRTGVAIATSAAAAIAVHLAVDGPWHIAAGGIAGALAGAVMGPEKAARPA